MGTQVFAGGRSLRVDREQAPLGELARRRLCPCHPRADGPPLDDMLVNLLIRLSRAEVSCS